MKITKYKIIVAEKDVELEHLVNKAIEGGWSPIGGYFYHGGYRTQAVVRYEAVELIRRDGGL